MAEEITEGYRLSPQQKHLWSLQQANHSSAYIVSCAVLIEGPLLPAMLFVAMDKVVARNEILRTTFQQPAEQDDEQGQEAEHADGDRDHDHAQAQLGRPDGLRRLLRAFGHEVRERILIPLELGEFPIKPCVHCFAFERLRLFHRHLYEAKILCE